MCNKLEIRKNGKLIKTEWVYNKKKKEGKYIDTDVTDRAIHYIHDICYLEKGLILKDLFLMLNTNLELFDLFFGNWLKEIVTEGLTKEPKPYGKYDKNNIEYLELYWYCALDDDSFGGYDRPGFGGVGYKLKEDVKEDGWIIYPKGKRINWGISFSPTNELINIPLRLSPYFIIYDERTDCKRFGRKIRTFKNATFTLSNIINGVIWELSFYGGPEKRKKKKTELYNTISEIKKEDSKLKGVKKCSKKSSLQKILN